VNDLKGKRENVAKVSVIIQQLCIRTFMLVNAPMNARDSLAFRRVDFLLVIVDYEGG